MRLDPTINKTKRILIGISSILALNWVINHALAQTIEMNNNKIENTKTSNNTIGERAIINSPRMQEIKKFIENTGLIKTIEDKRNFDELWEKRLVKDTKKEAYKGEINEIWSQTWKDTEKFHLTISLLDPNGETQQWKKSVTFVIKDEILELVHKNNKKSVQYNRMTLVDAVEKWEELRKEWEELRKEWEELRKEWEELRKEWEELDNSIEKWRKAWEELDNSIEKWRKAWEELDNSIEKWRKAWEELDNSIKQWKKEKEVLEKMNNIISTSK